MVLLATPAEGDGGQGVAWMPSTLVTREAIRHAARQSLGPRWTAPDGLLSIRPPLGFALAPATDAAPAGELGRFVMADDPTSVLRVGYVAGPILGELTEMVTVVHNVMPRLSQGGSRVDAAQPQHADVGGQPAVFSELAVTPPGAALPTTVHFYAYVANGALPGVLVTAVVPAAGMDTLRPVLLACVASLGTATVRFAAPGHEAPLVEEEVPDVVPFPVFLVATMILGATLLRLFSGRGGISG